MPANLLHVRAGLTLSEVGELGLNMNVRIFGLEGVVNSFFRLYWGFWDLEFWPWLLLLSNNVWQRSLINVFEKKYKMYRCVLVGENKLVCMSQ